MNSEQCKIVDPAIRHQISVSFKNLTLLLIHRLGLTVR
jgi:hypothetical protein